MLPSESSLSRIGCKLLVMPTRTAVVKHVREMKVCTDGGGLRGSAAVAAAAATAAEDELARRTGELVALLLALRVAGIESSSALKLMRETDCEALDGPARASR